MVPMMAMVVGTALTRTSATDTVGMVDGAASFFAVNAEVTRHATSESTTRMRAPAASKSNGRLFSTFGGAMVSGCSSNKILLMTPFPREYFLFHPGYPPPCHTDATEDRMFLAAPRYPWHQYPRHRAKVAPTTIIFCHAPKRWTGSGVSLRSRSARQTP